jgi:hypothetical protein
MTIDVAALRRVWHEMGQLLNAIDKAEAQEEVAADAERSPGE